MSRLATMVRPSWVEVLQGFPLRLAFDAMNRRSKIARALRGSELPHDETHVYARNLEVPSGGAVGTRLSGDPRDVALRDALYAVIRRAEGTHRHAGS